ncbi:hypothetical protein ACRV3Q_001692 [Enterobacter hormaechei]
MSNFTKEQLIEKLKHRISVASGFPDSEKAQMDLELARIALASLEAEPVAYIRSAHKPDGFCFADGIHPTHRHQRLPLSTLQDGCYWEVTPLYAAPPAPVSVPEDEQCKPHPVMAVKGELGFLDHFDRIISERDEDIDIGQLGSSNYEALMLAALDAFRAAMLQGAERVTTANKLPFEQWLSQQTGTIDVECGCVMTEVFFHWLRVAYEAGNSQVIPDGWVMVPAEPTQAMMNAWLSEVSNWRGHAAGYRAMIAAAPQQEVK